MKAPQDIGSHDSETPTKINELSNEESLRRHVVKASQLMGYNTQCSDNTWFSLSLPCE
jgi:hypothetical protein